MTMRLLHRAGSMAEVKKATIELFDSVYPLLRHFDIPGMDREKWHRLLGKNRSEKFDHFGYLLMEKSRAVGFLGGFFHEREIAGKTRSFCNLFCWYVMEEFRQQSLLLMLAFLREPDLTITSLTPSKEASLILKQFRFQVLEPEVIILPVMPAGGNHTDYEISDDSKIIASLLDEQDTRIFLDHDAAWCSHMAVWNRHGRKDYCHVVFNRVIKKGIAFTQVYYASNPELFRKNLGRIQRLFFRLNRTLFTVIDRRLLPGPVPFPGFSYRLRYPRLFRPAPQQSETLQPHQIDNLYTELLFLKKI